MSQNIELSCPLCGYVTEFDVSWLQNAELAYCGNCTKTFDLRLWKDVKPAVTDDYGDLIDWMNDSGDSDDHL